MQTIRTQTLVAMMMAAGNGLPVEGQQPETRIDGDDIVVVGCVQEGTTPALGLDQQALFWTAGDVMLAYAEAAIWQDEASELPNPFFYWLQDHDALEEHVGQMVEVHGTLGDFEEGTIDVKHDDGFTTIRMDVDGDDELIRVPSDWLGATGPADEDADREFDIVVRKLEIEDVAVLRTCAF